MAAVAVGNRAKKHSGTLQYDFGKDDGKNVLILKTDNLFFPDTTKGAKHKSKLDIKVKKSVLMTQKQTNRKLRREIRRRKKIERLLKKEKSKWNKKMQKKRKLMGMLGAAALGGGAALAAGGAMAMASGGGEDLEMKKNLKENLSMFKVLEKASFRDSMDLLFKVRLQFKALPGKINTLSKNYEEQLGYKEEAVEKALQQIDVKIGG